MVSFHLITFCSIKGQLGTSHLELFPPLSFAQKWISMKLKGLDSFTSIRGLEAHKTGATQMWSKDEKEAEQGSAAQRGWKGLDLRSLQCILPIRQGGKVYICDRCRVYI